MIPFSNPNPQQFEQMLDALTQETEFIPRREVMRKLLRLQFERDVAIQFADNFCQATGDISHLVNGFAQFKEFAEES
jgi:excinuclease UvrABC helicase subunit UvrB